MTTDEATILAAGRFSESTSLSHWNRVSLYLLVYEYTKRTGDNVKLQKVGRTNKAFDEDCNEISDERMIKIIIYQDKTMRYPIII